MFLFAGEGRMTIAMAASLSLAACAAQEAEANHGKHETTRERPIATRPAAAVADYTPASLTLNGIAIAPGVAAPGTEAPAEQVQGRWRVIDTAGGESASAMTGRVLSFDEAALGWVANDGRVEPGCSNPIYHVVVEAIQVRNFAPAFKAGWPKFRLSPNDVGAMHVWECEEADQLFGPQDPAAGSAFFPVGTDQLVMNWHEGTVLLLQRDEDDKAR